MNHYYPYQMGGQGVYGYPSYMPSGAGQNVYGTFPGTMAGGVPGIPAGATIPTAQPTAPPAPGAVVPGLLPVEESYIENILRLNLGKIATIYMTFENNTQWNAKIFRGVLEAAGRDHIIISDPQTGMRYLLLMVNLDYITFDEKLKYAYPYPVSQ